MNPNDPYNPNPQPTVYSGGPGVSPADGQDRKKLFIIGGAVAGLLIVILIVVLVLAGGGKEDETPPVVVQPEGPQAATTIGIEQVNNSISQDLSSMEKEEDFPAELLGDDALGL